MPRHTFDPFMQDDAAGVANGIPSIACEFPRYTADVKLSVMELAQKTRRPMLRPASFSDYDQIAALEEAYNPYDKAWETREQWLHLWQNNPAYEQLPGWPIGWVIEDEGRIVGSLLNVPC